MQKIVKYTALWAYSWLQLYVIFIHLGTYMYTDAFTIIYICASVSYLLLFCGYQIMCVAHKMSNMQQQMFERILIGCMLALTTAYAIYIFGNTEWLLSEEADMLSVLVEVSAPIGMLLSTGIALVGALQPQNMLHVEDHRFWTKNHKKDTAFLLGFCILLVLLVLVNSKLIPGLRRDYPQFARVTIQIVGISFLWNYSRYFAVDRQNFYAAMIGFLMVFSLEATVFFVYTRPGNIILLAEVSKVLFATSLLYPIIVGYILVWLIRCFKLERK